jgi:hypothetical protein
MGNVGLLGRGKPLSEGAAPMRPVKRDGLDRHLLPGWTYPTQWRK